MVLLVRPDLLGDVFFTGPGTLRGKFSEAMPILKAQTDERSGRGISACRPGKPAFFRAGLHPKGILAAVMGSIHTARLTLICEHALSLWSYRQASGADL